MMVTERRGVLKRETHSMRMRSSSGTASSRRRRLHSHRVYQPPAASYNGPAVSKFAPTVLGLWYQTPKTCRGSFGALDIDFERMI